MIDGGGRMRIERGVRVRAGEEEGWCIDPSIASHRGRQHCYVPSCLYLTSICAASYSGCRVR